MENICPICQSESKKVRSFAKRGDEVLDLYTCSSCGQEFLHPYPSDEWLAEEYSQYYKKRQAGLTRAKVPYFQDLFKKLDIDLSNKSVLELGPGEGDAIFAIKSLYSNVDITAVERNEEANSLFSDLSCRYFNMFLEEYLSKGIDQTKFDIILLFDVLEHLKDPVETLRSLAGKLKPNGKIIATFPVSDSLSRKVLANTWPQYKVEHLNYFTNNSIHILGKKTDLKVQLNEVLTKNLSLDYLLNVGKGFGPGSFQRMSLLMDRMTPNKVKKMNLKMKYGEKLVVFSI